MEIRGYADLVEIGRGASAVVYRATQVAVRRTVAIKVLQASLGEAERRRFDRECQTVAALGWHPHVVAVFDAGIAIGGHPYLALEYLPNGSLAERIRSHGPMSLAEVAQVGVQVADALDAAHRTGIVHRDVKPGNLLLGHVGDVKLADFGIAAVHSSTTSATSSISGTLAFMAPELFEGARASAATDLFALGATLFTLAAGRPPFEASTPLGVIGQVVSAPVPDLRLLGLPDELAGVVEKAMAKLPGDRFETATELVMELRAVQARQGWPVEPTYADRGPASASVAETASRGSVGGDRATERWLAPDVVGTGSAPTVHPTPVGAIQGHLDAPTQAPAEVLAASALPLGGPPALDAREGDGGVVDHRDSGDGAEIDDPLGVLVHPRTRRTPWRVLGFLVPLLIVLGVAAGAIGWSAANTYFVTFDGDQVAVFRGRPGGVLWFDPTLEDTTKITRDEVPPALRPTIAAGKEFGSRSDADRYLINLETQVEEAIAATSTTTTRPRGSMTTSTSTSTTAPTTAPATTIGAPTSALQSVDWANRPYVVRCYPDGPPVTASLVDGSWLDPSGAWGVSGFHVQYGDADGDGSSDAILTMNCGSTGFGHWNTVVMRSSPDGPVQLGQTIDERAQVVGDSLVGESPVLETVEKQGNNIVLTEVDRRTWALASSVWTPSTQKERIPASQSYLWR